MRHTLVTDIETYAIDDADQYIESVDAPANYKDAEKIAAYIEEARIKALGRCALDPDLCRIVALGWVGTTGTAPMVFTSKSTTDEKDVLTLFWRDAYDATLVTFNGFKFDIPILIRRSQYLRIPHPVVSLDRYRSPHLDLLQWLTFNGAINAHSLKFYLARFGIVNDDLTTGKDIAGMVKAGDWEGVKAHCEADVLGTKLLAQRLGLIEARVEQPVAEGAF